MNLAEFERRITDASEALSQCAQCIKEDDSFKAEGRLLQAIDDLQGCKKFASDWADAQEREIGKAEEAKGYEIVEAPND